MRKTGILLVMAALAGCATQPPAKKPSSLHDSPQRTGTPRDDVRRMKPAEKPQDVQPGSWQIVQLTVYQMRVPYRSVSRSEEFWKRVNEQCLDAGAYDLLFKNGLRIGVASAADWDYFKNILERSPAKTQPLICASLRPKTFEVDMKKGVPSQTIFDFDRHNTLTGRSYDRSDNLLSISFQPAPRKPGSVRIAACPVIRSQQSQLAAVTEGDRASFQQVYPEKYFDVGLCVDVPLDSFLIISPSSEADWNASLGNAMFLQDGGGERLEQVLLIVPSIYVESGPSGSAASAPAAERDAARP